MLFSVIREDESITFKIAPWFYQIAISAIARHKGWDIFQLVMKYNYDIKISRRDHQKKIIIESYSGPLTQTLLDAEEEIMEILRNVRATKFTYGWYFYVNKAGEKIPVSSEINSKLEMMRVKKSPLFST
mmetsp:Transcript_15867/g.15619  ORF Transcript_15867/g.15619 Transcript_15867/m.15619 type:complete len:129 (-) Transcript_15867:217-603(-)